MSFENLAGYNTNIYPLTHSSLCLRLCAWMLSCVQLFGTPWTAAHQALLSIEFSRQEYWSGLPFPTPGNLPDPGIKNASLVSTALAGGFFTTEPPGKPLPLRLLGDKEKMTKMGTIRKALICFSWSVSIKLSLPSLFAKPLRQFLDEGPAHSLLWGCPVHCKMARSPCLPRNLRRLGEY